VGGVEEDGDVGGPPKARHPVQPRLHLRPMYDFLNIFAGKLAFFPSL
jgi:hypothetical protein